MTTSAISPDAAAIVRAIERVGRRLDRLCERLDDMIRVLDYRSDDQDTRVTELERCVGEREERGGGAASQRQQ